MRIEKKRISISLHPLILIILCLFHVWFLTGCPGVLPTDDKNTDNGQIIAGEKPRHVILFIGDGMGTEHIKAAGMYSTGVSGLLSFESFPYKTLVNTASASGSITKSRDVNTQAVFSLKGKPLNTYNLTKKIVYENEEFNLLQSALNIEDGQENLRYNNVIIATDADVDGMHIRLLLITFFLKFFPDLIIGGHLKILQTPLFRVRNNKKTFYCYTDQEKISAINKTGKNPEITRFKGLGEISPNEFKHFIGKKIRLDPVYLSRKESVSELLSFYMGKNTPERQDFIIQNLRIEEDPVNSGL